jgi:hypothetical protein
MLRCRITPCTTHNTNKNFVVLIQPLFLQSQKNNSSYKYAEVAHLVERDLAKVEVAGSSPVFRSLFGQIASVICFFFN